MVERSKPLDRGGALPGSFRCQQQPFTGFGAHLARDQAVSPWTAAFDVGGSMSRVDDDVYRPLTCGDWRKLRHLSPLAIRVFFELFWGDDSERAGIVRYRPGALADDLRSSKRAVVAAVAELSQAGLIEASELGLSAARLGFANRFAPKDRARLVAWQRSIPASRDPLVGAQEVAILDSRVEQSSLQCKQQSSQQSSLQCKLPKGPIVHIDHPTDDLSLGLPPQDGNGDKRKRKPTLAQKPPTREETLTIFASLGCPAKDAERVAGGCYDYWLSQGWRRRTGPIVDWPATCRTWWRNALEREPGLRRAAAAASGRQESAFDDDALAGWGEDARARAWKGGS